MMLSRTRIALGAALLLCVASAVRAQDAPGPQKSVAQTLSPALSRLKADTADLRLDKWKASGRVRRETDSNLGSIQRDVERTLPGLIAAADGAPGMVSKSLPVYRNVDALYDVLLRVEQTASDAAPKEEKAALRDALNSLEGARRELGDAIEKAAANGEQERAQLREQLAAAKAAPPVTKVVEPDEKPVHHHRHRAKKAVSPPQ